MRGVELLFRLVLIDGSRSQYVSTSTDVSVLGSTGSTQAERRQNSGISIVVGTLLSSSSSLLS